MKEKTSVLCLATLVLTTLVMTSCKRTDLSKIASGALSPELAIPIGSAKFTVAEVLASKDTSSLITTDEQGALKLVYSTGFELLNIADVAQLDDQQIDFNQTAADYGIGPSPLFTTSTTVLVDETFDFNNQNGEKLYSIDLQDGNLVVTVSTDLQHEVEFNLEFPDILVGGSPSSVQIVLDNPQVGQTQTGSASIDLSNAVIELDNGSQGFNEFRITGSVSVVGTGNPIIGTESVDFSLALQDLAFDVIYADFGQQTLDNFTDTIDLRIFNNFIDGMVEFTNPTINFNVLNSFGIPLELNINEIKTVENSGAQYSLISNALNFDVNPATIPGNEVASSLTLDASNTQNLGTIISPAPKKLVFDLGGGMNPAGPATNFVASSSSLYLEADVDLPLEGYATGFTLRDTMPFELSLPNEIEKAMLRLVVENGFPIDLNAELYLADASYNILGQLNTSGNIITGAPVNSAGRVTSKTKKITDIVLTNSEADNLQNTKYLIVVASCQTTNGQQGTIVKFYDDYEIEVKLAAQIKGAF